MLKEQIAIITGASSGIGEALANLLASKGATVVLAARRIDALHAVAEKIKSRGGSAIIHPCDVTVRAEAEHLIRRTLSDCARIDVLVNNAGRGHFASVEDTTDEMIQNMFKVNAFALWYTVRPVLAHMKERRSGHIINIASMAGKLGYPYNSAYVAAKHACVGFTMALRQELLETGVHASVICPAGVRTEWANVTEGGSMLPLFSESGPIIKKLAADRNVPLPQIEGVMSPEAIADRILECILEPSAEVYTHRGAKEFVELATRNREEGEQQMIPVVLGEREVYERVKGR